MKKIYLLMLLIGMIAFTSCSKEENIAPDAEVEAPLTKAANEALPPYRPTYTRLTVSAYYNDDFSSSKTASYNYRLYRGYTPSYENWIDQYDGSSYDYSYRGFEKESSVRENGMYTITIYCSQTPYNNYQRTIMTRGDYTDLFVEFDNWGRITDNLRYH